MQQLTDWLEKLGLGQYAQRFAENDIDTELLPELTDMDFDRLGVSIGHRRRLLKALAAGVATGAEAPSSLSANERAPRGQMTGMLSEPVGSTAAGLPGEMIGGRMWDIEQDDDRNAAETYGANDYSDDLPKARWRGRLRILPALLGLAGLGVVGALAYRAVFTGAVFRVLPAIIKAENGPNKIGPTSGDAGPSNSGQPSRSSAGASEGFVGRWPDDVQEAPGKAITLNSSAPTPSAAGSGAVAQIATALAAPPPSVPPPELTAAYLPPSAPASIPAAPSSTAKRIDTVSHRTDVAGQSSGEAVNRPGAKPSAPAALAVGNQPPLLAPDAQGQTEERTPAAKPSTEAAHSMGNQPLSLLPDERRHPAASAPSQARISATRSPGEGAPGRAYAVQVASERSAADASAIFRSLQAKFPDQLGGREAIVRRTDVGPEGIYYRALIGPFTSRKEAAGVCSKLKAAGDSCLIERD